MRVGMLNSVFATRQAQRLVRLGHRDQQVGVGRPGDLEDGGRGGIAGHDAQVETLLEGIEALDVAVNDGDVVGFRNQAFSDRAANLASAENDDLHCVLPPGREAAGHRFIFV